MTHIVLNMLISIFEKIILNLYFFNRFCTGNYNQNVRPVSFTFAGVDYNCAWSTFSSSLRSSVTFIAAIFNLIFIYIVIYKKKFFQYLVIYYIV